MSTASRPTPSVPTDVADMPALSPLQRAFIALEDARARLKALQHAAREPIAVVGLGCRVPGGGDDPSSLWRLLRDGVDATGPLPAARWDSDALYHADPDHPGTIATRRGGFLAQVDAFDPTFFGITRREAQGMDPQQRLFLEVCWEALEHAGQAPDRLDRSATGVYVGMAGSDYAYLRLEGQDRAVLDAHFASGIGHSVASGRVSYLLGLQGPSLTVDTACSSSLVAVHLACQALRAGDCGMALAGGVNLILSPDVYVALSRARMLSPDGRCKAFDASADGFGRGEGSAVVVLKRLSDAESDGDRVLAVIRGSAVNQDGASSGLTAPSGPAQEAVIREALARAGVAPRLVGYVEAHGTGTQLGDPLELRALGAVFGADRDDGPPLYVGSVKTNLGHLEAAAGVTGLIKLVLALQHRAIPAHLHYRTPSPHVPWGELRVRVPTALTPWEPIDGRRIAGVSSFGFSGTNVHVVLEEAPAREESTGIARDHVLPTARRHVFVLSGHDDAALRACAARYAAAFADGTPRELADVCYTAAVGRAHHGCRAAVAARSLDELRERLTALAGGEAVDGVRVARVTGRDPTRVAFLCTGQGAQYVAMGRDLFDEHPVFRAAIARCAAVLDDILGRSLVRLLYPAVGEAAPPLDETRYTQPALFAVEYAVSCLWKSWGITPAAVIGHSVGEYVAATIAGVLTLEDALRLVAERGRLMQALPPGGAMAAIFAAEADVAPTLVGYETTVSVAAVNAPGQTVVSGTAATVDAICDTFAARGIRCQRLAVSHAFHSPLVDPMLDAFERAAHRVTFSPPTLPMVSNVTGRVADAGLITQPAYWREHVRAGVRFADGMRALAALRPDVCLEIGPQPTLLSFARDAFEEPGPAPALVPSLRQSVPDRDQLDEALGALYVAGAPIDWRAVWLGAGADLVDLPTYAFQRERCWFSARRVGASQGRETGHPLLGVRLHTALRDVVQFERAVRPEDLPYLRDHRVQGRAILPGAAFIEMALSAAREVFAAPYEIRDLVVADPLVVGGDEIRRVQTVVRRPSGAPATFEILSTAAERDDEPWQPHAHGVLVPHAVVADAAVPAFTPGADVRRVSAEIHRAQLAARDLLFGPSLHGVQCIDRRDGEALGVVTLPDAALADADRYVVPPALLDACLQVLAPAIAHGAARDVAYIPLLIDSVRVHRVPGRTVTSHAVVDTPARTPSDTLTGRVVVSDDDGVVMVIDGVTLRAATAPAGAGGAAASDLYRVAWERVDDAGRHAAQEPAGPALPVDRRWLILADAGGVGTALAARLEASGREATLVAHEEGDCLMESAARAVSDAGTAAFDVVHLWSLDLPQLDASGAAGAASLIAGQEASLGTLLATVQALGRGTFDAGAAPRLWIATRGAQPVEGPAPLALAQSPVWGLGRAIAREHPELRPTCVDLDPAASVAAQADSLLGVLAQSEVEDQYAVRGPSRFVPRLVAYVPPASPNDPASFVRLEHAPTGVLDDLALVTAARAEPGAGQVAIEIHAAGLNFRDVMNAVAMRADPEPLGGECAGRVVAVGEGVTEYAVGDAVAAIAEGCFATYALTDAAHVAPLPPRMTFAQAVTVPFAFMTAKFALHECAAVRAGDTVLIHAAAGGVGLAAVELARAAGATIIATAGSAAKRAFLRARGVEHVADSRSLAFEVEVLRVTDGRGADVVLNSLAGDFIAASVRCLAPAGRFLEIGKRDIWTAEQFADVRPGGRYWAIDLAAVRRDEPARSAALFRGVMADAAAGRIHPLPLRAFALRAATAAFRHMAQARHIGKVVLVPEEADRGALDRITADATYLVTGGLTGLGLLSARRLVERGARHLVLIGRRAPGEAARCDIEAMRAAGADVRVVAADVSRADDVTRVLRDIDAAMPPLRGIIHSAGALDDGALVQQAWSRFTVPLGAKVDGTWALHAATCDRRLDFFVLYSSIASVLGSAGQGSYAAANAFQDALASHRRACGLPATSISWGAWAEIGVAADRGVDQRVGAFGIGVISPERGLELLDAVTRGDAPHVAAFPVRWDLLAQHRHPVNGRHFLDAVARRAVPGTPHRTTRGEASVARASGARMVDVDALRAASPTRRHDLLLTFVSEQVAAVIGAPSAQSIEVDQPLNELGLDSLMAVELRNRLSRGLQLTRSLPATLVFEHPTLESLARHLTLVVAPAAADGGAGGAPVVVASPATHPDAIGVIDELTDEQIDALFASRSGTP